MPRDKPARDSILKEAGSAKCDKVILWEITRLGSIFSDLIATLNKLQKSNVDLKFLQNKLVTSTTGGWIPFSIFGAIGEFERSLIRQRIKAGLDKAVRSGMKLGR